MANRFPSHYPDIGVLGEELVAQWLNSQGWVILNRRWRSRWGEIDIIACSSSPLLVFVEVKTRRHGNWDSGGLLSITQQKQRKLYQTAQYFLARHPHLVDYPCRFDVALVHSSRLRLSPDLANTPSITEKVQLGQPVSIAGQQLTLKEYIPSAFE